MSPIFFWPFFDGSGGGEFIRQPKYFLLARKILTEKKGGDQNVQFEYSLTYAIFESRMLTVL